MNYFEIAMPAGIITEGTELQKNKGSWIMGNRMRWRNGIAMPIGSNDLASALHPEGVASALKSWRISAADARMAIGTNKHVHVFDGSDLTLISPVGLADGDFDAVVASGYGVGNYGAEAYGTARTVTAELRNPATWHFDNFGSILVGVRADDGVAYKWDYTTDNTMVAIPNAPTSMQLVTSKERALFAIGVDGDPRKIAWSDRENFTSWTPAIENTAGDLNVNTSGRIVQAIRCPQGILLTTDADAHLVVFEGGEFVYGVTPVSDKCNNISPHGGVSSPAGVIWMGYDGFYMFDGYVKKIPCSVQSYLDQDIDKNASYKIYASTRTSFNEIWWCYQSHNTTTGQCDSYVSWNYLENTWMLGRMAMACMEDKSVMRDIYGVNPTPHTQYGVLSYINTLDNTTYIKDAYLDTSPLETPVGANILHLSQLVNDELGGNYTIEAYGKLTPMQPKTLLGTYQARPDGYTDVRITARELTLRFKSNNDGNLWRIGRLRGKNTMAGRR